MSSKIKHFHGFVSTSFISYHLAFILLSGWAWLVVSTCICHPSCCPTRVSCHKIQTCTISSYCRIRKFFESIDFNGHDVSQKLKGNMPGFVKDLFLLYCMCIKMNLIRILSYLWMAIGFFPPHVILLWHLLAETNCCQTADLQFWIKGTFQACYDVISSSHPLTWLYPLHKCIYLVLMST